MTNVDESNEPNIPGSADDTAAREYLKERIERDAQRVTPEDLERIERTLPEKMKNVQGIREGVEWVNGMVEKTRMLFEMIRDKNYRVDLKSKALIIAGLLYFIVPLDTIPDFIPGLGYIDDALVISTLWKTVKEVLDKYIEHRGGLPTARLPEPAVEG